MRKSFVFAVGDWRSVVGCGSVDFPADFERRLTLEIVSQGCSVYLCSIDEHGDFARMLIFCGAGEGRVQMVVPAGGLLLLEQDDDSYTSFRCPEYRFADAGWQRAPSFADLDPKPMTQISAEMQHVVDMMNANAVKREMMLLKALERRLK